MGGLFTPLESLAASSGVEDEIPSETNMGYKAYVSPFVGGRRPSIGVYLIKLTSYHKGFPTGSFCF
jgi:hypothetical protein